MDLPADRMVLRAGTLDLAERVFVRLDGGRSPLTEREVSLVRLLAALEGRTVPRADLLHRLWPAEVTPRVIDTAVARLRAKVEVDRHRPDHLVTAFGDGYRWVANLAAVAPLPAEPELFLGRAGELEALRARLGAGGAVTSVVGAPGLGKTRLALRLAHELRTAWPGGAVFVELAEVRHGATVDRHVASALRLEASAPEALTAAFAGRGATLLVLDDCDAVQDAVRGRVAAWRGAQPALRVVVTSRIALGLPDEIVVALDPLPHDAAAALFLQRAERHGAPWIDDPRARDQIPALVEGLERNALAIELAAGRASALGPQQLLQRLTDRFRLLRSRERGASPRHRTLDAALDVSWQLLDGARQRQIAALSVFRGGFDAEAARAVAGDVDPSDGALVVARGGRCTSYQFVREYAAARLAEAPDREREAIGRHVEHFASRVRRDPPEALVADEANLEVAVERAIALGRPDLAAPLAVAWFEVVNRSGPLDLVIAPLRRVLERTASPAVARALGSSLLATGASEEAWQVLTRALEGGGDPRIEALVHLDLANLHRSAGRPEEARASAEAALAAARAAGDAGAEGLAHGTLATLDQVGGRPDAALRRYELALERHVLVGDRRAEGRTAANLGSLALGLGRLIGFSQDAPHRIYNWELFVHVPLRIAERLTEQGQYAGALRWLRLVMDPAAAIAPFAEEPSESPRIDEAWRPRPLWDPASFTDPVLKNLMWTANPFDVHGIAENDPQVYRYAVARQYVETLAAWGDDLFSQDTMASIAEATQLYLSALQFLGPRPIHVELRTDRGSGLTFADLRVMGTTDDGLSNPLTAMENLLTQEASGEPTIRLDTSSIDASGTIGYFCEPQNDRHLRLWDTLDDRLYKIRHCMNIDGVVRTLPIFEPPIDPGALVAASAAGMDLSELQPTRWVSPHVRFGAMLGLAKGLTQSVQRLSGALLQAMQGRDGEALSVLRQQHEIQALQLADDVRRMQVDEARLNQRAAVETQKTTQARHDHYQALLDDGLLPGEANEEEHLDRAAKATNRANALQGTASTLSLIPEFTAKAPIPEVTFGGRALSGAVTAVGAGFSYHAAHMSGKASEAARKSGRTRRRQEWKLQRDLAAKELQQIAVQIDAAGKRVEIAQRELANHRKQVASAHEVDRLLRTRFTNQELYSWTVGQLTQLHSRTFQLALEVARKAEVCFRRELGVATSSYVGASH